MISDEIKTTPIGLANYAEEFFDCALISDEHLGQKLGYEIIAPIPVMYLASHSIELCLKAYLLYKAVPLSELKKRDYGHDLIKCLKKANKLGLGDHVNLDDSELNALTLLNNLYLRKELNYIVTGEKEFPVFGFIQSICTKLIDYICPLVKVNDQKIKITL